MWGIKLVHTPDRSRQERILEAIKERRKNEHKEKGKEKKNVDSTN